MIGWLQAKREGGNDFEVESLYFKTKLLSILDVFDGHDWHNCGIQHKATRGKIIEGEISA